MQICPSLLVSGYDGNGSYGSGVVMSDGGVFVFSIGIAGAVSNNGVQE